MYKYHELYNIIERQIECNELKQGTKLSSIRDLCAKYNFSQATVVKALELLKEKNLIYSIPQSGYYITSFTSKILKDNNNIINFASASPDSNLFPYLDFQQCINQAIEIYKEELFEYGDPKGLAPLINIVKKFLMNYQVYCKQKNIFITSGVQQAISLLINMPFPNKKETILIEQPSYHLIVEQLETINKPVKFIERTKDGLDLKKLEEIFKNDDIKFFYLMPRFHNPLGFTLSEEQKKKIVFLSKKYSVYLLEDDFLADLETINKYTPMHYYYELKQNVIYLKSFSKIIFPGLRVGIAIIPDELCKIFYHRKAFSNINTSMLSQASLEIYIKSRMFEKHSAKLNKIYNKKAILLHEFLIEKSETNNNFIYEKDKTPSIQTCIELKKTVDLNYLKKNNIYCRNIKENYLGSYPSPKNYLAISVSSMSEDKIIQNLEKLFSLIK